MYCDHILYVIMYGYNLVDGDRRRTNPKWRNNKYSYVGTCNLTNDQLKLSRHTNLFNAIIRQLFKKSFTIYLMADSSLLNDVFELLEIATQLEETGNSRIEAATKVCTKIDALVVW